jgi:hypothetical protein
MSNESLQTIILGIVAIVLLLQISMLAVAALLVTRVHKRFEELFADACEMVRIMRLRAEQWDVTLVQIGRIVQIVQNRVEHADGVAKELLNRSLQQTFAADRIVSDLLSTLESATQEIKEVIKKPLREARALNAAVRPRWRAWFLTAVRGQTNGAACINMHNTVPTFRSVCNRGSGALAVPGATAGSERCGPEPESGFFRRHTAPERVPEGQILLLRFYVSRVKNHIPKFGAPLRLNVRHPTTYRIHLALR